MKTNTYIQYYIKPGGYEKDLEDFDSVKPVNSYTEPRLQTVVVLKTGRIVDKNLAPRL